MLSFNMATDFCSLSLNKRHELEHLSIIILQFAAVSVWENQIVSLGRHLIMPDESGLLVSMEPKLCI